MDTPTIDSFLGSNFDDFLKPLAHPMANSYKEATTTSLKQVELAIAGHISESTMYYNIC